MSDIPIDEADEPIDAVEAAEAPPPEKQIDPETEATALRLGWRRPGESNLPENRQLTAEAYLGTSKAQIALLKENLSERDKRIEAAEHLARTAAETVKRQERARYDSAIAEIAQRKVAAVEGGDVETYKKLEAHEERLRSIPQPEATPAEVTAFFADEKHAWTKDPVLAAAMEAAIDRAPDIRGKPSIEQLRWADEQVRKYYPHMFAPPEPPQPREPETGRYTSSKVDGGGLATGSRTGSHGLSAEESAEVQGMIRKGWFKDVGDYVKYAKQLGVRE